MIPWWQSFLTPWGVGQFSTTGLELAVFITGLVAVALTASGYISGLLVGVVNIILAGVLYYHSNLYSDFFLQFYYLSSNVLGLYWWRHHRYAGVIRARTLMPIARLGVLFVIVILTITTAFVTGHLHIWLPVFFPQPAAYLMADALILGMSITAQWLMVRRYIENWYIWLAINILAVCVYSMRDLYVLAVLFFLYGILAFIGMRRWQKLLLSR